MPTREENLQQISPTDFAGSREGPIEIEGAGGGKRMLARLQQYILVNWGTHQVAAQERQSRGGAQPRCALLRVLPSHLGTLLISEIRH